MRLYETDGLGCLAPGSLCDFLSESAANHAAALGVAMGWLRERHLTWVLARLRLSIARLPGPGGRLEVLTWPTGAERLFAVRDFRVVDETGGEIATAVSAWLLIDTATRRPVRIQSVFDPPDVSDIPRALEADLGKLPAVDTTEREATLVVRLSDLDENTHVNNARIVDWIVEGAGPEVRQTSLVSAIDLDYLAETLHGDTVVSRTAPLDGDQRAHLITRPADGREIARARTTWRPRGS